MSDSRLERVLSAIDAANAADPRRTDAGSAEEVDHARRRTEWVLRLQPGATDALRIAARGQHIERWTSPRSAYPEGRAGYLRWREDLKRFHARRTGELMAQAGYGPEDIERVSALITKAALRAGDPEGVALEDALCLVFLETQFPAVRAKTPEDKMRDILAKTWKKMSPPGRAAALALSFQPPEQEILARAVGPAK